ncbi:MAG: DUF262 domain-containing HNH endonuclease family protein [Sedimentisphaerales bacterium]|jgi:uncharacterized protein with ParB-like and HNH nuclease domain
MLTQQVDFKYKGIATVLNQHRLTVPPNQREFSWQTEHVKDLFQDLSGAIRLRKPVYFLGTVVFTIAADSFLEVADGQQRLATITILLAAIRDYYSEHKEDKLVQAIENAFLFDIDRRSKSEVARLTLNLDDRDYFIKRILSPPNSPKRNTPIKRESHELIDNAAKHAAGHVNNIVAQHSVKEALQALEEWTQYLENQASVIVVIVPDSLNAFRMFETLNDRGLKVSQADLVKNFLFGEAGKDNIKDVQHTWAQMTASLETLNDEDSMMNYFRSLLIAMYGYTKESEIFDRIHDKVSSAQQALDFANILGDKVADYTAIISPDHAKWNKYLPSIKRCIESINNLRIKIPRPIMLAISSNFEPLEAVKAFKLILSWSVRFLIVGGGRGGSVNEGYAKIAHDIWENKIINAKAMAKAAESLIPNDAAFEASFASASVALPYLARYYLRSIENKMIDEKEPEFLVNADATEITLEHILPENPLEGTWSHFDPSDRTAFVNRIGNLALLKATPNSDIGGAELAIKAKEYVKSGFAWTRKIAEKSTWGTKEITERQTGMAKWVAKTWPLKIDGKA